MDTWVCPACTTSNNSNACFICGEARPNVKKSLPGDEDFARSLAEPSRILPPEPPGEIVEKECKEQQRKVKDTSIWTILTQKGGDANVAWSEVAAVCQAIGEAFTDPEFPPLPSSVSNSNIAINNDSKLANVAGWRRPSELQDIFLQSWVVFRGTPSPDDIVQGTLGNCWLMSAISVVAQKPYFLRKIIVSEESGCTRLKGKINATLGAHQIKLCVEGIWRIVIVDDFLPVRSDGQLAFSKGRRQQLWPSLIEKAAAKIHGSYAALASGNISEGLALLSGCPTLTIELENKIDYELIWGKLLSFQEANFPMGASCCVTDSVSTGLQNRHAYALLSVVQKNINNKQIRLIQLRNPWGEQEKIWKGDWSPSSKLWTHHARQQVGYFVEQNDQNDGIFWMSFEDFLQHFSRIDLCKLRPDFNEVRLKMCQRHSIFFQDKKGNDLEGGNLLNVSVVQITVLSSTSIDIVFHQSIFARNVQFGMLSNVCLILLQVELDNKFSFIAAKWPKPSSSIVLECNLLPGSYIVVPLILTNFGEKKFVLSFHSFHPVLIENNFFQAKDAALAFLLYAKAKGKMKRLIPNHSINTVTVKSSGGMGYCILWPASSSSSLSWVPEALRSPGAVESELLLHGENISLSRGNKIGIAKDIIKCGEAMVQCIASQVLHIKKMMIFIKY
eukprot:g1880.t1